MVKIKSLVLWSNDFERKIIDFNVNGITLLIGESKAGKTAIISIIDYCLASSGCDIPASTIRDCCSWFGVVLKIGKLDILFARKSPENLQTSEEMYFEVLENGVIPSKIETNRTRIEIRDYFNGLFGITNLFLNSEYSREYVPSFRDTIAINFFPQGLLLDNNYYFYKQHSNIHNQNFNSMFPYMVGLISIADIMQKKKIESLKKKLRWLEKDKNKNEHVIDKWEIDSEEKILKSLEYGLLECNEIPKGFKDRIELLKSIDMQKFMEKFNNLEGSINTVNKEILQLKEKENDLYHTINKLKRMIREIEEHSNHISEFEEYQLHSSYTKKVSESLINDEYLLNHINKEKDCYSYQMYQNILDTLKKEEQEINFYKNYKVSLDNEYISYKRELEIKIIELKSVKKILNSYILENMELQEKNNYMFKLYAFVGELRNYIKIYDIMIDTKTIDEQIEKTKNEIMIEEAKLNKNSINERYKEFEFYMNGSLQTILDTLNVEYKEVIFDARKIDFLFDIGKNRVDLSKIGSGSNYVEYHIAMALLIHLYIQNKVKNKCTFDFVIFDQPSEAYFPTEREDLKAINKTEKDLINDTTSLKALYQTISDIRKNHCPTLQVILFEHADDKYWRGYDNRLFDKDIKIINWKGSDEKLIPKEWINKKVPKD